MLYILFQEPIYILIFLYTNPIYIYNDNNKPKLFFIEHVDA